MPVHQVIKDTLHHFEGRLPVDLKAVHFILPANIRIDYWRDPLPDLYHVLQNGEWKPTTWKNYKKAIKRAEKQNQMI